VGRVQFVERISVAVYRFSDSLLTALLLVLDRTTA